MKMTLMLLALQVIAMDLTFKLDYVWIYTDGCRDVVWFIPQSANSPVCTLESSYHCKVMKRTLRNCLYQLHTKATSSLLPCIKPKIRMSAAYKLHRLFELVTACLQMDCTLLLYMLCFSLHMTISFSTQKQFFDKLERCRGVLCDSSDINDALRIFIHIDVYHPFHNYRTALSVCRI